MQFPRNHVVGGAPEAARARVLLADDNKDMRAHIQRLLESRFDITAVSDGAAALESALSEPPDLVRGSAD